MKTIRTFASLTLLLLACSKPEGGSSVTTATSGTPWPANPAAKAAPSPSDGTKDVDLAPLPLKVKMPSDETATTMDKTMAGSKSVGVSYDAVFGGINVSEASEKSFEEVKKAAKKDTVMFPFERWAQESPTSAVEEFTSDGKTAFIAWSWKPINGKNYVCQSSGLSGMRTQEDAAKVLKVCDSLTAK